MDLSYFENLPYFTLEQFVNFCKNKNVANVYLYRLMQAEKIFAIKRGIFVSKKKLDEYYFRWNMNSYLEFLATNVVYEDSYLSLEYILSKNNILSENVYNFTSISRKKTNRFSSKFGKFLYRNIKTDLFWWYDSKRKWDFLIYEAKPEKALLDYLWLKKDIVFQTSYFDELRLDLSGIDYDLLYEYMKKFDSGKMEKVFRFLEKRIWYLA